MIVLFTDFGINGPYVGQMKSVLLQCAPGVPIIDLMHDAPRCDPFLSSYLFPAYSTEFPKGTVFLCVVDPGVGSARRKPVALKIGENWYVGPDNGLFNVVALHAADDNKNQWWDINWKPDRLSASFHGRDLFAPVAAKIALGQQPPGIQQDYIARIDRRQANDLNKIIYIDTFGNALTGVRASVVQKAAHIKIAGNRLKRATTFSDVNIGQGFWYENANGLVEIAVNQGRANDVLDISLGDDIDIVSAF